MGSGRSYVIPHDIPDVNLDYSLSQAGPCRLHKCLPIDGPGTILYDGQIFVRSIGGFYDRRKKGPKSLLNPRKLVSYLDFHSKQLKYGDLLPRGRVRHCTVIFNESTALIYGGTFNLRVSMGQYLKNTPPAEELRSGWFIHFPDVTNASHFVVKPFEGRNKFPCGKSTGRMKTTCSIRKLESNQKYVQKLIFEYEGSVVIKELTRELVVPAYDIGIERRGPCTAILNLETLKWRNLPFDGRGNDVTEAVEHYIIK